MSKDLITVQEAAAQLGITPPRVYQLARALSPAPRRIGDVIVLTRAQVEGMRKRKTVRGRVPSEDVKANSIYQRERRASKAKK